jgi:hypothetical protein
VGQEVTLLPDEMKAIIDAHESLADLHAQANMSGDTRTAKILRQAVAAIIGIREAWDYTVDNSRDLEAAFDKHLRKEAEL